MSAASRIAHNESIFREINERIEAGHWPQPREQPMAFRCECAKLGCNVLVSLTLDGYERVRADATRFLLCPGHELPDVEVVVERHPGYIVVEKQGEAARVAERTDPR